MGHFYGCFKKQKIPLATVLAIFGSIFEFTLYIMEFE